MHKHTFAVHVVLLTVFVSWNLSQEPQDTMLLVLNSFTICGSLLKLSSSISGNPHITYMPNFILNTTLTETIFFSRRLYPNYVYAMVVAYNYWETAKSGQKTKFVLAGVINISQLILKLVWSSMSNVDIGTSLTNVLCICLVISIILQVYAVTTSELLSPRTTTINTHKPSIEDRTPIFHQGAFQEIPSSRQCLQEQAADPSVIEFIPKQISVILNHIDNGIVVYNPSHEVIFSNSKAKSLLKAEDDLELIQALQLKLARYLALLNQRLQVQKARRDSAPAEEKFERDQEKRPSQYKRLILKKKSLAFGLNERSMVAFKSLGVIQNLDESQKIVSPRSHPNNTPSITLNEQSVSDDPKLEFTVISIQGPRTLSGNRMYKVLFITDKTPKIKSKEIKLIHKFNHLLLNSFSHELRTPLNCSFQLLEALMMEIQDRNLLDNYIQPIISSNHLLLHQINDILDYASFESDNFQYTNQKFELVQLARRVTEIFRYGCECKQISITTESNFDTIYLSNDPKRISQVLVNLMNNSTKFTNQGGKVVVRIEQMASQINIAVIDDGIGIEAQRLLMVRRVLSQEVQDLENELYIGLGLKVSNMIVRGLTNRQSGNLEVESVRNKGTRVSFFISDKAEQTSSSHLDISLDDVAINVSSLINNIAQQKYQASKSMFTFCKHHPPVLVVDDVSFNVMALKLLLSKRKLASDECYNGYDALQKVKARFNQQHCQEALCKYYKFILMDIEMPIMDGLTATEKVADNLYSQILDYLGEQDHPTRVVICSAYDSTDNIQTTKISGASGFLPKPIEKERLFALLQELQ